MLEKKVRTCRVNFIYVCVISLAGFLDLVRSKKQHGISIEEKIDYGVFMIYIRSIEYSIAGEQHDVLFILSPFPVSSLGIDTWPFHADRD